jgi:hypothetical protein
VACPSMGARKPRERKSSVGLELSQASTSESESDREMPATPTDRRYNGLIQKYLKYLAMVGFLDWPEGKESEFRRSSLGPYSKGAMKIISRSDRGNDS